MALGKRGEEQEELFVTHQQVRGQSHPYYRAVNKAIVRRGDDGFQIDLVDRARIQQVRETPGLSRHQLSLCGPPDEPPLAVLRYTHRRRRAIEVIRTGRATLSIR